MKLFCEVTLKRTMANQKKGLGRGLDALFSNSSPDVNLNNKNSVTILKIFEVKPNKDQPRKDFDQKLLTDLANSIKDHGVLQPILVKPDKMGNYQIIAGERRWRASKMAGLDEIPAIIKELNNLEMMEIALIENIQRSNLNVIEEALGYKFLADKYNMSQDAIASRVGKSRPAITNALRLLNLPDSVINLIKENKISAGHARALLTLENKSEIEKQAEEIFEKGLSVREVENIIKFKKNNTSSTSSQNSNKSNIDNNGISTHVQPAEKSVEKITKLNNEPFYNTLQQDLIADLNRNIKINYKNGNKKLEIEFYNQQDLINITDKIRKALK